MIKTIQELEQEGSLTDEELKLVSQSRVKKIFAKITAHAYI